MNHEDGVLGPYKDAIDAMFAEEREAQHKKRLTAKHIFDRIVEKGYKGSYSTVRRYVRERRDEFELEEMFLDGEDFLDFV